MDDPYEVSVVVALSAIALAVGQHQVGVPWHGYGPNLEAAEVVGFPYQ